jgi:hypothetical protein
MNNSIESLIKTRISSWTGVFILFVIATIVWGVIFFYSGPAFDSPIVAISQNSFPVVSHSEKNFYAYQGAVAAKNDNQIIIQLGGQTGETRITGLISQQTDFFSNSIPKTNPEGARSGKLFDRQSIKLDDIQLGDQIILNSFPDTPVNGLTIFPLMSVELKKILQ